jgi:hypothetical protein
VGKTAGGANMAAHIVFGPSGNGYFDKLPLYAKFPYPKFGRIVSDPTTIQQTIIPELKRWFPAGATPRPSAARITSTAGRRIPASSSTSCPTSRT